MQKIKKPLFPIVMILSGVIAGILISSIIFAFTGFSVFGGAHRSTISAEDARSADMTMLAYDVLRHIRDDDFIAFSRVVHPEFGVVFSPSATINLSTDRRFNSDQVATLNTDTVTYVWGVYNGSGEPIELTPPEYFNEFVPASRHLDSPIVGINHIIRSGNALENIKDVFPDVRFVDFHVPGGGGEMSEEFDWSSLRLGFEEYDGSLWLTVIVHSTWTD